MTIPEQLNAGDVVEIHSLYDHAPQGVIEINGNGTPANPIFIRGNGVNNPRITRTLRPKGNYQIYEHLELDGAGATILYPYHHISIRHCELHNRVGTSVSIQTWDTSSSANTVHHIVVYDCDIHHNGKLNPDMSFQQVNFDAHGILPGPGAEDVWILDSRISRNQGDGIQCSRSGGANGVDPSPAPTRIYIGRNDIHSNGENALDFKVPQDVIVSGNRLHGHVSTLVSGVGGDISGANIVVQNDTGFAPYDRPKRVWFLFNEIFDAGFGGIVESGDEIYFVGNVIYNITETPGDTHSDGSPWRWGAGIQCNSANNVYFYNNTIADCTLGMGLRITGSMLVRCQNNVIANMKSSSNFHLAELAEGPGSDTMETQASFDHNLFFQSGGSAKIKWAGGTYDVAGLLGAGFGSGSLEGDPLFAGPLSQNFRITAGSPAIDSGTAVDDDSTFFSLYGLHLDTDADGNIRPFGAAIDMGAYEGESEPVPPPSLIYVDQNASGSNDGTTWANAFNLLSDGLDAAAVVTEAEIWVTNGTYVPSTAGLGNPRDATFAILDQVAIYGGFEGGDSVNFPGGESNREDRNPDPATNGTILSGDLNGDDGPGTFDNNGENAYHVVTAGGTNATAVLDGFSIQGGHANSTSDRSLGGGIYNIGGSPTLANCRVKGNRAIADGAGMYNKGDTLIAAAKLTDCTFEENITATSNGDGAGFYSQLSNPTLTNCAFTSNSALGNGGGFFCFSNSDPNSWPTLTGCTFTDNESTSKSGGGAYMFGGGPIGGATVTDCTFTNNSCNLDGGGIRYEDGDGFITDTTFTGNDATNGGGMSIFDCEPIVRGCTFVGNTAVQRGGGIRNSRNDGAIVNCRFLGNIVEQNGGGLHNSNARPMVINCIFSGNQAGNMVQAGSGGAIWNGDSTTANLEVLNCTISENEAATSGGALYNEDSADPIITNSIIWNNRVNGAISEASQIFIDSGTVTVTYSCVRDDEVDGGTVYPGTGNIDADPSFVDPDGMDNLLGTLDDNLALSFPAPVSPCTDAGSNFAIPMDWADLDDDGNRTEDIPIDLVGTIRTFSIIDMGAYESGLTFTLPRLYVDAVATGSSNGSSWADAYSNLLEALIQADNSQGIVSEIWVVKGTYTPTGAGGDRTVSFPLADGVRVTGGFVSGATNLAESDPQTNLTILSGDLNDDDLSGGSNAENSHHVVTASLGISSSSILEGFTIVSGHANGSGQFSKGAGLYNDRGNPTISNCVFMNHMGDDGAGAYTSNGSPTFLKCTFVNNTATLGGGLFTVGGNAVLGLCLFQNNSAEFGGGMYSSVSDALVMNSHFMSNTADFGGGLYSVNSTTEMVNCLFSGNLGDLGAAAYTFFDFGVGIHLVNCTVTGNTAAVTAGGLYNSDSSFPTLSNCVVWGNADGGVDVASAQVFNESSSISATINHSCIQDDDPNDASVYAGTNNIDNDPLFLDADGPDDSFGTADDNPAPDGGSPVIDAGDNSAVSADVLDLDGDGNDTEAVPLDLLLGTRFRNVTTDMGAIEWDPSTASTTFYMADSDFDGDVDGVDFAKFAQCFNRAGNPPRTLGCSEEKADIFDFDDDNDVDGVDFAKFAQCFNKAGNPPRTLGCPTY